MRFIVVLGGLGLSGLTFNTMLTPDPKPALTYQYAPPVVIIPAEIQAVIPDPGDVRPFVMPLDTSRPVIVFIPEGWEGLDAGYHRLNYDPSVRAWGRGSIYSYGIYVTEYGGLTLHYCYGHLTNSGQRQNPATGQYEPLPFCDAHNINPDGTWAPFGGIPNWRFPDGVKPWRVFQ